MMVSAISDFSFLIIYTQADLIYLYGNVTRKLSMDCQNQPTFLEKKFLNRQRKFVFPTTIFDYKAINVSSSEFSFEGKTGIGFPFNPLIWV